MHEEHGTILVFVLRRFGSRGEARRWPSTLGWLYATGLRASCMSDSRLVMDNRRTEQLHVDARSSCTRSPSLGVEYRSWIAWCMFPLQECNLVPFCVRLHVQIEAPQFQVPQRPSLGQGKHQNKGRVFFYFVSPCLYLSVCRGALI